MIDHVSIVVARIEPAADFYDRVLATLGMVRRKERPGAIGYGPESRQAPVFWILESNAPGRAQPGPGLHISLQAPTRASVDTFYQTALAAGGRDAGAPGLRPQYTMPFYGAFILDPDGYKIEAVCRADEDGPAADS